MYVCGYMQWSFLFFLFCFARSLVAGSNRCAYALLIRSVLHPISIPPAILNPDTLSLTITLAGLFENVDIQLNRIPLTLKTLCCFFTAFPLRILRLFAYLFLISELGFKIVLLIFFFLYVYVMYFPHLNTSHTQKKEKENKMKKKK